MSRRVDALQISIIIINEKKDFTHHRLDLRGLTAAQDISVGADGPDDQRLGGGGWGVHLQRHLHQLRRSYAHPGPLHHQLALSAPQF